MKFGSGKRLFGSPKRPELVRIGAAVARGPSIALNDFVIGGVEWQVYLTGGLEIREIK